LKTMEYVSAFERGDLIHPAETAAVLHLNLYKTYKRLEVLVDKGILTSVLEVFCPHCKRFTGITYDVFWEIPDKLSCPLCGEEIEELVSEDTLVVYRKL